MLLFRMLVPIDLLHNLKSFGMTKNKNIKSYIHLFILMLSVVLVPSSYAYEFYPQYYPDIRGSSPSGVCQSYADYKMANAGATVDQYIVDPAATYAIDPPHYAQCLLKWHSTTTGQWYSGEWQWIFCEGCTVVVNNCPSGGPDESSGRCIEPKTPPCDPPCSIKPPVDFKNPINITTGNKHQIETDYVDAALSGLTFKRIYNSLSVYSDSTSAYSDDNYMGIYWRHNYSQQFNIQGSEVVVSRSNGRKLTFTEQGSEFVSDADITTSLNKTYTASVHDGWEYHPSSTVTETYNLNGQLTAIQKADGRNLTFHYDTDGIPETLDRVDDFAGRSIQLHYDANRQIDYIVTPNGQQIDYTYDAYNIRRLKTVTNTTTGDTREYHYEYTLYPNYLTGITDERGIRYATWTYDTEGRAITSEHANGVESGTVTYNAGGSVTTTDSRNTQTTSHFTEILGVNQITQIDRPATATTPAASQFFTYDAANGQLASKTDWDGTLTEFGGYDSNNNLGYKIEALGTPEQRRTDYKYEDPTNYHKITKILEPSVYAADPTAQCTEGTDCKITTYTYDTFGNRTSVTINGYQPDGTPVSRTTGYLYNGPLNQLSQIDGPRSDVSDITTLNYHPNDAAEGNNRARLEEIIDANNITLRGNIQYTATGKVLSEDRPNGLTLDYSYTPGRDRLETLTQTTGTGSRTTRWSYLATGEVKTITQGDGTTEATTITFGYDDARRLVRVINGNIADPTVACSTTAYPNGCIEYTLDTEGNKEFEKTYDNTGALQKSLEQTFDAYNRLDISKQELENETSDYDYNVDGTLDQITDGNNSVTDYSYDNLKRLTTTTQNLGGTDPTTQNALTQYSYDAQGNLTTVTDPNNGVTGYLYDDLGNLLVQGSPDTGDTLYTYDAAGNLATKTDAKGQLFSYSYDALNRLTLLDAPGTEDDISYSYDNCTNGVGQLCSITKDPNGTTPIQTSYSYTPFGEVDTHQGLSYSYDNAGRIETITYPSSAIVTYHYDSVGQINQIDLDHNGTTTTLASNISYKSFGPMTGLTYGTNPSLTLTQNFDTGYRMTSQTIAGLLNISYPDYDANGNLKQQTEGTNTTDYSYDALNRLDIATGNFGNQNFDHDKVGNRTSLIQDSTSQNYSYEPDSNRLDQIDTTDIQLDLNGNTTQQGTKTYSYNSHNRLIAAYDNGTLLAAYHYNGLGQRISKGYPGQLPGDTDGDSTITAADISAVINQILGLSTAGGNPDCNSDGQINVIDIVCQNNLMSSGASPEVITTYAYGLNGQLIGEYDSNGTALQEIIYLNGQPIAALQQDDIHYIHSDHLGTPRNVINSTGNIIWRWQSDPFGTTLPEEDVDGDGTAFTMNLRFAGQQYDGETGLHYNYFRTYDPSTGRYLESDPIGLAGGLNTYAYVEGNPIGFFDPFGLKPYNELNRYIENYPSDPTPNNRGRWEPRPNNKNGMQPPGKPFAPWTPSHWNNSRSSGCAPYYSIGGGLLPLVSTQEEEIEKCTMKVTCFYSGTITDKFKWKQPYRRTYVEYKKQYSFTKKVCCQ